MGDKLQVTNEELCKVMNYSSKDFIFIEKPISSLVCIEMSSIEKKCIAVPYTSGYLCLIKLVNTKETD